MKHLTKAILLFLSFTTNGQIIGEWYTFRIDEILCNKIYENKLITYRIGNYELANQHTSIIDTFTVKENFWLNDSTLYVITSEEPDALNYDDLSSATEDLPATDTLTIKENFSANDTTLYIITSEEPDSIINDKLSINKFVFHKETNTLTSFYYNTMKSFYDLKLITEDLNKTNIENFISKDTAGMGYVTFYTKDSIDRFLKYPRLFDQPADTVIKLYNDLISVYSELRKKTQEELMPYFLLKGLSKSVVQAPIYLKHKTYPLVERDNFEANIVREKFKNNKAVLEALYKFEALNEQ